MQIISSRIDLETWIANANPLNVLLESGATDRLADAIQAADHPAWGSDWAAWLDENAERIALEATAPRDRWFAALGTNGRDPVVWGLGHTEAGALADGERELIQQCDVQELRIVSVTPERAAEIEQGAVAADDLWSSAR